MFYNKIHDRTESIPVIILLKRSRNSSLLSLLFTLNGGNGTRVYSCWDCYVIMTWIKGKIFFPFYNIISNSDYISQLQRWLKMRSQNFSLTKSSTSVLSFTPNARLSRPRLSQSHPRFPPTYLLSTLRKKTWWTVQ